MHQQLVIFLNTTDIEQSVYVLLNEIDGVKQVISEGNITSYPRQQFDDVIVIVPTLDVTLLEANLPKMSRARLIKALPFALEEQLLTDINELHFVTGPYQTDGSLPVAIVAKQKMAEWLNALSQKQLVPSLLIPDVFLLPVKTDEWWLAIFNNSALLRTKTFAGSACDLANLDLLLSSTLTPDLIHVENYSTSVISLKDHPQSLVIVNHPAAAYFRNQATQIPLSNFSLNLLQGNYRTRKRNNHANKYWRRAAYLALSAFMLALLSNIIFLVILKHKNQALENKIAAIYFHYFPQSKRLVAPKERMQSKLHELTSQNNNQVLVLLGRIAKVMSKQRTIHLDQFDFHDHQLSLSISAPDFAALDGFAKQLSDTGLQVKQQNVTTQNSQVKAELVILEDLA